MPEEPSLDDLHTLFDWSSLNILDKVEGKGLALDFPQLLHNTMAEALKLRSFNYQDPNDYLLELNVPSKYFESKLNLEKKNTRRYGKSSQSKISGNMMICTAIRGSGRNDALS